jgi:phosphoenolpyruvate-protein kinase (PTS system EI component)
VVERGSLLSHSAIVARELGIPCVVGLKGATNWIEDGETISVDGATGLVERTMHSSEIATKAAFDHIRYAQLWEDADVLTEALGDVSGGTLVSICSAGDNALAMLTLDPAKVVVVDLSPAQIACLQAAHRRVPDAGPSRSSWN